MKVFIPAATLVYFFGFAITTNYFYELAFGSKAEKLGIFAIICMSLINSFLASSAIAWLAMPKRRGLF